jgi:hypothetical protein
MKAATDIRITNAVVEFIDRDIDSYALNALAECMEILSSGEYSEPPPQTNMKGMRNDGNDREDTE